MSDKIVYDGWLKVVKRQVGNKIYDILKDHDAVCAIITNQFNEVLLVRQFRPALMEETLELPAGTLDISEEDAVNCIIRELKEETGLDFEAGQIEYAFSYIPMMGFSNSLMKVYYLRVDKADAKSTIVKDEDVFAVEWINVEELGIRIQRGEILDVKAIIAYLFLKNNELTK